MSKILKIVHISDVHIRTFRYHDEYREVFTNLIDDLKIKLSDYKYDEIRIVIVGDLFHQKITISNEQTLLASWFISELQKISKVIIIPGNHDLLENNKSRLDSITPIVELINSKNVDYYKESKCIVDNNVVWCVYSVMEENKRPDIDESKIYNENKKHIGLYHAPVIGAKTDIGFEFEMGQDLSIFEGCDFVMMGDIHKRQTLIQDGIKCVFSGSLIQQNFGETIGKHGYLVWDVETSGFEEYDVKNENLFYTYKITSMDDIENDGEVLMNG